MKPNAPQPPLSNDHVSERLEAHDEPPPDCPECQLPMVRYAGPEGPGWLCLACADDE